VATSSSCQTLSVVAMRPDRRPLSDEAQVILRHATVADLKADAAELSKLFTELDERERERLLVLLFGTEV
jgi:hypothetical protein